MNEFGIPEVAEENTIILDKPTTTGPVIKEDENGLPYRSIRIEQEHEKENYLPVGHNGKVYQIMRGIPVEVPQCVVDVLNDCIGSKLVDKSDGMGGVDKVLQDYHAIPFSLLR